MGLKTKKGVKGPVSKYLTRAASLRKLQISLASFRRLCILKGIYPREPKRKPKGKDKTYYHAKDILHLYHEPLLQKLRDLYAFEKKYKRAMGRREKAVARSLQKQRPSYALYHIVKERYSTLLDAVRDLDDALSTIAVFTCLSCTHSLSISADVIMEATRLFDEFLFFCAQKKLVRKVFCSIKGFYVEIKCLGQPVVFLMPHELPQEVTDQVDYNVLLTFLEFYCTLLKTVLFKLFSMEGWTYPPQCNPTMVRAGCRFLSLSANTSEISSQTPLPSDAEIKNEPHVKFSGKDILSTEASSGDEMSSNHVEGDTQDDVDDQDSVNDSNSLVQNQFDDDEVVQQLKKISQDDIKVQTLFSGLTFFISREVPFIVMSFLVKSCGCDVVAWEAEGSPLSISEPCITHHIIDRPMNAKLELYIGQREFIQPQWVFDCINARKLLPIAPYGPGVHPPAHLSPFVDGTKEGSVPQQRSTLMTWAQSADQTIAGDSDEDTSASDVECAEIYEQSKQQDILQEVKEEQETKVVELPKKRSREKAKLEAERERRKALLSKKHKRLLERIEFGKERENDRRMKLQAKREARKEVV